MGLFQKKKTSEVKELSKKSITESTANLSRTSSTGNMQRPQTLALGNIN
jgi:ribosomal protein L32